MILAVLVACSPPSLSDDPPLQAYGPVTITFDAIGMPHIRAQTDRDAIWGQGYAAAQQRIFQMDLLRRRARGRRAEVLGERFYASDLQSRSLRFADWGRWTFEALQTEDPEMAALAVAYADGVNAWLAEVESGDAALPPQFAALGTTPEPWTPEDCLAIETLLTAGLSMRPTQDITLGLTKLLLGDDLFADFYSYSPFDRDYVVPDFYAGRPPMEHAASVSVPRPALSDAEILQALKTLGPLDMRLGGSNNWVVSPERTANGHALLAGDSHQGMGHPAVYWLVHLSTTGSGGDLDVQGASFPGVPFVVFGANRHAAFAPTTSIFDAADAYIETWVEPGESVSFRGETIAVEARTELVTVRLDDGTHEEREVELYDVPHHGPMLPGEALGLPIALDLSIRWNGYTTESVMRTFYELDRADSFEDFRSALDGYHTGGMHWVYADVDGHIGYSAHTRLPIRERLDPATPPVGLLPGTGGFEWLADPAGIGPFQSLPREDLPWALDPPDGILTTANNDPTGQTDDNTPFDAPVYLSGLFDIGTRSFQTRKVLEAHVEAGDPIDLDAMAALQLDDTSRLSERLLPFLLEAGANRPDRLDARSSSALEVLSSWDHRCRVDAAGPMIFQGWLALTAKAVLEDEANGLLDSLVLEDLSGPLGLVISKFLIRWLEATAADIDAIEAGELPFPSASGLNFFDDQRTEALETRDEVLLAALDEALDQLTGITGEAAPAQWRWGDWHGVLLEDPSGLAEAASAYHPKGGCLYTVDVADADWLQGGALPQQLIVDNAASNRFVWELDPNGVHGRVVIPGGQAESPDSPFHNSQLEAWLAGEAFDVDFR